MQRAREPGADPAPAGVSRRVVTQYVRVAAVLDPALVVGGGAAAVADRHGPPLEVVGGQQAIATPTLDQRGQHPAEVTHIADPGVHAVPAGRRRRMRGVAGAQDPAHSVSRCRALAATPGDDAQDLERDVVAADGPPYRLRHVDLIEVLPLLPADDRDPPHGSAVDRGPDTPGSVPADEDVALPGVPLGRKGHRGNTDHGADRVVEQRALELHPGVLAHGAAGSVAPDQVPGAGLDGLPGLTPQDGTYAAGVLIQALEGEAVPDVGEPPLPDGPREQRVELVLRASLPLLGRRVRGRAVTGSGDLGAADEMAEQRGRVHGVARVVVGEADLGDLLGDAPPAAHLHGALVQAVGLRQQDGGGARVTFGEGGAHAPVGKVEGEGQPHRATPDDQDRGLDVPRGGTGHGAGVPWCAGGTNPAGGRRSAAATKPASANSETMSIAPSRSFLTSWYSGPKYQSLAARIDGNSTRTTPQTGTSAPSTTSNGVY